LNIQNLNIGLPAILKIHLKINHLNMLESGGLISSIMMVRPIKKNFKCPNFENQMVIKNFSLLEGKKEELFG